MWFKSINITFTNYKSVSNGQQCNLHFPSIWWDNSLLLLLSVKWCNMKSLTLFPPLFPFNKSDLGLFPCQSSVFILPFSCWPVFDLSSVVTQYCVHQLLRRNLKLTLPCVNLLFSRIPSFWRKSLLFTAYNFQIFKLSDLPFSTNPLSLPFHSFLNPSLTTTCTIWALLIVKPHLANCSFYNYMFISLEQLNLG